MDGRQPLHSLTTREREVVRLVAHGRSNAGIARDLLMSERTVEAHLRRIYDRLVLADSPAVNRRVLVARMWLEAEGEERQDAERRTDGSARLRAPSLE